MSVLAHRHPWPLVQFPQLALDLVCNRDYSVKTGAFWLNTLAGHGPFRQAGDACSRQSRS